MPLLVTEQEAKKVGKKIQEMEEEKGQIRPCVDWENVTWNHGAETEFLDVNSDCIKEQLGR